MAQLKKFIGIIVLLFLVTIPFRSCSKNIIQISNVKAAQAPTRKDFNSLTATQMMFEIQGVGETKSNIILAERQNNGIFISPEDFERRMQGKLSDRMIYKILSQYSFGEGCNGA